MNDFKFSSPRTLLNHVLDLGYFCGDEPAIPYHRVDGKGRLVVVVGDNASGKSFCRRIIQAMCQKNKIECIPISAEHRRKVSYMPWLTFVYGDEEYEATGVNSVGTVLQGINTCKARETNHVIFWDEPDLGLSDSWAAGVGQMLCEFAKDPPKHTVASFVVSHNKALVRELLPAEPFYLHLGSKTAPATLEEWVEKRSPPRDPSKLPELSRKRFKAIQAVLDRSKP